MAGLFKRLFGKKAAPKNEEPPQAKEKLPAPALQHLPMTVENQNGRAQAVDYIVEDMLTEMFADDDQFVTLSLEKAAHDGVRFVQACRIPDGIDVQLGIEIKGGNGRTELVEKVVAEQECMRIFLDFYDTARVEGIESYTPVQMYRG